MSRFLRSQGEGKRRSLVGGPFITRSSSEGPAFSEDRLGARVVRERNCRALSDIRIKPAQTSLRPMEIFPARRKELTWQ
jgi:hypothetical protein